MRNPVPEVSAAAREKSPSLRDVVSPLFRQKRTASATFGVLLAAAAGLTAFLPQKYESQIKLLVQRERYDPVVSPEPEARGFYRGDVTEEQLRSEVELLRSHDLLEKVAARCGLGSRDQSAVLRVAGDSGDQLAAQPDPAIARAALDLSRELRVESLKKTNVIVVRYASGDPQRSYCVLERLGALYLEKHLGVHRRSGAFEFFEKQAALYRGQLETAEAQLAELARSEGVVAPAMEQEMALRKLADFEAELLATRSAVAEAEARIRSLEGQAANTPERRTAAVRTLDNSFLLQQHKTRLLELELKRTELLTKFQPGYRLVQEVDEQIRQTRDAIAAAQATPLKEETTDRDPAFEWLRAELARARAERETLAARATATARVVNAYRRATLRLDSSGLAQKSLLRAAHEAEENYQLYSRKQEEARIGEALDRQGIANVSVADAATLPLTSSGPGRGAVLLLGILAAVLGGVGMAYLADHFDPRLRTPEELADCAELPVLAAVPRGSR